MLTHPHQVITACAGSGKTHQLIARLLTLLLQEEASPASILAITYTRKATAEIRQRLLSALEAQATDSKQAARCYRRLLLAEKPEDHLHIHTFHSWFSFMLSGYRRRGWYVPPQIAEDDRPMRELAWQQWCKKHQDSAVMTELLMHYTPDTLKNLLVERTAAQVNAWRLYNHDQATSRTDSIALLKSALNDFLFSPGKGKAYQKAQAAATQFLDDGELETLEQGFLTKDGKRRKELHKNAEKMLYLPRLDAVYDAITAIKKARIHLLNASLRPLIDDFFTRLEAHFEHHNLINFNELEYRAYKAITDPDHGDTLLYEMNKRFRHLLIDEFQDTSPLQWSIVRHWLHAVHGTDIAPSVFIVGDEKQSIYRFRHGDARLLEEAKRFLAQYYNADLHSENICRRCSPVILNVANHVFQAGKLPGFTSHHPAPGVNDTLPGRVEWHLLTPDRPKKRRLANPLKPRHEETPVQQWARTITATVRDILAHWTITEKGRRRPCQAEDILILLSQTTHGGVLTETLSQNGMACYLVGGKQSFLESLHCRDMLALCRVLLCPDNARSLAQILKSPIFSLTDDDVAQLVRDARHHQCALWQQLMRSDHLQAKEALQRWQQWAQKGRLPTHDLLSRIVADGDMYRRYQAAVAAPYRQKVTRELSALLDLSLTDEGGQQPLLQQFLARIHYLRSNRAVQAESSGIRISTVHSAKGLESPIVIIANADKFAAGQSADRSDSIDLLIDWPPGHAAPKQLVYRPRNAHCFDELKEAEEAAAQQEYNRLLYVAMTRAKQGLVIFYEDHNRVLPDSTAALKPTLEAIGTTEDGRVWVVGDDLTLPTALPAALVPEASTATTYGTAIASREDTDKKREKKRQKRQQGEAMHRIIALRLAGLTEEAIAGVVCQATADTWKKASTILQTPMLCDLRANNDAIYLEREFAKDGKVSRLDVLVVQKNTVWIIEFKSTPGITEKRRAQLENYRDLIQPLYPQHAIISGILSAQRGWQEVVRKTTD